MEVLRFHCFRHIVSAPGHLCYSISTQSSLELLKFKMVSNAFLISSHSHNRQPFECKKGVQTLLKIQILKLIKSFSFVLQQGLFQSAVGIREL